MMFGWCCSDVLMVGWWVFVLVCWVVFDIVGWVCLLVECRFFFDCCLFVWN